MIHRALPYYLEDRTGVFTRSDFDDAYDRAFLRISTLPPHLSSIIAPSTPQSLGTPLSSSLAVYTATRRSSPANRSPSHGKHQGAGMRSGEPVAVLHFGPRGALGNITFLRFSSVREGQDKDSVIIQTTLQMGSWLKKTSLFGGSLSRKFKASTGEEFRWLHNSLEGQEWSLVDSRDQLVAHYNLRPLSKPAFTTSGNMLVIYESYVQLAVEILASLTVMRHIAVHNL